MAEKRLVEGYDFVRAVCTLIVVCYHYSLSSIGDSFHYLSTSKYNQSGIIAVSTFFMLSGATLYLNYSSKLDIKNFYIKRWLKIYPIFYLAWFPMGLLLSVHNNSLSWGGGIYKFILTLLGLDGYFLYLGPNYYILGEWFLGAIIMLYALFPLLRYLALKNIILTTVIILSCYFINAYASWFLISDIHNMITCILSFWIGMIYEYYRNKIGNKWYYASFVLWVCMLAIPIGINSVLWLNMIGYLLFMVLIKMSYTIMKNQYSKRIIKSISKYSYAIYLVHHVILWNVLIYFKNRQVTNIQSIGLLLVLLLFIYLVAIVLYKLNEFVVKNAGRFLFRRPLQQKI